MIDKLFKTFLKDGVNLLSNTKHLNSTIKDTMIEDIDKLQNIQVKELLINDFSEGLSDSEFIYDYIENNIVNSIGVEQQLVSLPITGLSNIIIKNLNILSTNAVSRIEITLDDTSGTTNWIELGTETRYEIGDSSDNGISFRITTNDNVISKMYVSFEIE
jgi:hypothetical protein